MGMLPRAHLGGGWAAPDGRRRAAAQRSPGAGRAVLPPLMRPRRGWMLLFAILLAGAMPSGGVLAHQAARSQPYAVTGVVLSVGRGLLTLRLDGGGSATFRLVEGTALAAAPASGGGIVGARVRGWGLPV